MLPLKRVGWPVISRVPSLLFNRFVFLIDLFYSSAVRPVVACSESVVLFAPSSLVFSCFVLFFSPSRVCCFDRLPPASGTKALYLGPTNIHVFYWGARRRGRTTSKSLGFILGGPIGYSAAELGVQESQTVAARFSGSCAIASGVTDNACQPRLFCRCCWCLAGS